MQGNAMLSLGRAARRLALAATVVTLSAAPALAQPAGGPMQGGHFAAPITQSWPHLLEGAKDSLNLNTSQQALWDSAVAQSRQAHAGMRANRQQLQAAVAAEIAKPEPDLAGLAATTDAVEQQNRALRQSARAPWLALYATFSPDQKAIVRGLLQQRVADAQSFRSRMMERMRAWVKPAA